MKIKLLTCLGRADGIDNAGDVIERPDAEAQRLIDAGFAEPVGKKAAPKKNDSDEA